MAGSAQPPQQPTITADPAADPGGGLAGGSASAYGPYLQPAQQPAAPPAYAPYQLPPSYGPPIGTSLVWNANTMSYDHAPPTYAPPSAPSGTGFGWAEVNNLMAQAQQQHLAQVQEMQKTFAETLKQTVAGIRQEQDENHAGLVERLQLVSDRANAGTDTFKAALNQLSEVVGAIAQPAKKQTKAEKKKSKKQAM